VKVDEKVKMITISLKKKRNMPELLTTMHKFEPIKVPWLDSYQLVIEAASNS